ncbi:CehA/McbA family metallohydrolase [Haloglomus halophilum]|uniref:CehA/McbA family metallohydrolase n=1 Tax=Haloglomus halophilum TaxID=2962672 RepID=UPI0020C9C753|nr:PHP domain-containing protein [Haloglomus halophilum]
MEESPFSIDPHVHSEGSYDGREPVELLLEHAADIDLDAIVVTDHDTIEESLRAARLAPAYGLVGVPGVEVSTADGHLLAIGVEECPTPGRPLPDTVATVREMGGVAVVPHPFQRTRHGVPRRRLAGVDVDGIETYNAWLFTGYRNRRAAAFARRYGHADLAGSDAHRVETVGRAFTALDLPTDGSATADDVVAAIRRGDTAVHGRRAPLHRCAGHYVKGAARKSGYAARKAPGVATSVASAVFPF